MDGARNPFVSSRPRASSTSRWSVLIRFQNVGLRYGLGEEVVSDLNFAIAPQSFQFPHRPLGRRQDDASAPDAALAQAHARHDPDFRPGRGDADQERRDRAPPADRRRLSGFRLLDHLTTYENVALPLRALGRRNRATGRR